MPFIRNMSTMYYTQYMSMLFLKHELTHTIHRRYGRHCESILATTSFE